MSKRVAMDFKSVRRLQPTRVSFFGCLLIFQAKKDYLERQGDPKVGVHNRYFDQFTRPYITQCFKHILPVFQVISWMKFVVIKTIFTVKYKLQKNGYSFGCCFRRVSVNHNEELGHWINGHKRSPVLPEEEKHTRIFNISPIFNG